jgi:acetyltransferase-like isoleucine patch superfamily enzyme
LENALLNNFFQIQKARLNNIKLKSFKNVHRKAKLILEEHVNLEQTRVLPNLDCGACHIGAYSYIRGGEIHLISSIGRYCSIGNDVMLGMDKNRHPLGWATTSHEVCLKHKSESLSSKIGHDVWIGQGAVVLSGVEIGTGAVIGINAVVAKNVLPYEIVAGNPARHIRFRFDEDTIELLLKSSWWNLSVKTLRTLDYDDIKSFIEQVGNIDEVNHYAQFEISNRKFLKKT